jgi:hypothetical protein
MVGSVWCAQSATRVIHRRLKDLRSGLFIPDAKPFPRDWEAMCSIRGTIAPAQRSRCNCGSVTIPRRMAIFYRARVAAMSASRNEAGGCAPDRVVSLLIMKKGTPLT